MRSIRRSTAASFIDVRSHQATSRTPPPRSTELDADTSYQVRVRATNSRSDDGPWSLSSEGSTNKEGQRPAHASPKVNPASCANHVGDMRRQGWSSAAPVSATDTDNVLPLTYRLHGPDADSFDLQRVDPGRYGRREAWSTTHETNPTLNVTVTVSDRQGGSDARAVTITVNERARGAVGAGPPDRSRDAGINSRSLDVTWSEPENMGAGHLQLRRAVSQETAAMTSSEPLRRLPRDHQGNYCCLTDTEGTSGSDESPDARRFLRGVRAGPERRNPQRLVGGRYGEDEHRATASRTFDDRA